MVESRQRHDSRIVACLRAGMANGQLKKRGKSLWTADDFDAHAQSKKKQSKGIPLDKKGMNTFRRLLFGIQ